MIQQVASPPVIRLRSGIPAWGWMWFALQPPLAALAAHVTAILLIAQWWLPAESRTTATQLVVLPVEARIELPPPIEITTSPDPLSRPSPMSAPSIVASSKPPLVTVDLRLAHKLVASAPPDSLMGEAADLVRLDQAGGGGEESTGQGEGHGYGTEFFGVHAGGRRFVFVVDSSRSMSGRRWVLACRELLESVERLGQDQSFYVIFFDSAAHPMFAKRKPEKDLLPATDENRTRLRRWISGRNFGFDTAPASAMQIALQLDPDAIFLLSDGEFRDGTALLLRSQNRQRDGDGGWKVRIPVHTIGFHSIACQAVLRPLAAENGGEYRFVPHPRAKTSDQLSRVTP